MAAISKLAKFFVLPAACAATGVVCITMYLTNQANTHLNSLNNLYIDNKPEIEEEEIKPVELPPPPTPVSPTNPSPENQPVQDSSSKPEEEKASDSSQSQNPNTGGASEGQDVKEVIKRLVQEMNNKHTKWAAQDKTLGDFYEIVSRSNQFIEALKALSKSSESK